MLEGAARGDRDSIDAVYASLYPELHAEAHRRMSAAPNAEMLDTTSLVNEAYLRFIKTGRIMAQSRQHFMAYSSRVMRSVVIDYIRHSRAEKRGGNAVQVTLNSGFIDSAISPADEVMRLNDLLDELAGIDPRLVSVVEMRYFASLDIDQIAENLGVTGRTIKRDLEKVRLLLMDKRP